ncbi:MAG TPA: glycerol-3-phosphate dehydrogenase/oxidase [Pirellulales bacterium]|nr:glycerol-3-phosphate dehydrogenase/oxidase [Pirellulales bacterium]
MLVLGAGINGCAIARELVLGGVAVWLVDTADIASGTTAGSSRLVHGGLRYLEFGELDLVKESLHERTRLLRLAPQFVHPLRLWIPVSSRFGGMVGAAGRFFGWRWWPAPPPSNGRGITLVRAGLSLYDAYARDPLLPKHQVMKAASAPMPVDRQQYRWLCSYHDAQVAFPERLVLALLQDARELAAQQSLDFRVFTYHQATRSGETIEIHPLGRGQPGESVRPAAIVNATGAWVDHTLGRLQVPSGRLIGGTKGSHAFTFNDRLRDALSGQGIYAEARDGRPIFITPLADAILIGTTDEPFEGPPEEAVATERELDYLLDSVNAIFPAVALQPADIDFHYSAVRPLPYVDATTPAAITRRHSLVEQTVAGVPLISVVGGKLTTMRSLAELTAQTVLGRLGRQPASNSRDRVIPGGEDYPANHQAVEQAMEQIAARLALPNSSVARVWKLCGTRCESILASSADRELLGDTQLPCSLVRWSIHHEWARTLADLVERRLMLLYDTRLTRTTLRRLAELLAESGMISAAEIDVRVEEEIARLKTRYGKRVV